MIMLRAAISSIVKRFHLTLPFCYLSWFASCMQPKPDTWTEHLDKRCLGRLSVGKLDSCMLPVVKPCICRFICRRALSMQAICGLFLCV